jgi:hypothetical protein
MLRENAGLIWSIVRRYCGRGVDSEDLYQLGCLGFLNAGRGFDASFGTQCSTYALPKIAGGIGRFLRDDGTVKVGRGVKERAQTIRYARDRLEHALGREPTLSEIAAETGLAVEYIAVAEIAGNGGVPAAGGGRWPDPGKPAGDGDMEDKMWRSWPPGSHSGARRGEDGVSCAISNLCSGSGRPGLGSPGSDLTGRAPGGGDAAEHF